MKCIIRNHKKNGGRFRCFYKFCTLKVFVKISLLQELIFDMNNRADPGGINDPDYSRQPKTLQQKKWEFFDKLEQLEQK